MELEPSRIVTAPRKYQVQFIVFKEDEGWARVYVDEYGRLWATFSDKREDVVSSDAEFMNISESPEFLKDYRIVEIRVYEL